MPNYAPFGQLIPAQDVFGAPPTSAFFANLTATPTDYSSLSLTWMLPVGNWNEQKLVRSSFGYPNSIYAGISLLDQTANYSTTYRDSPLRTGQFYYYTLFVFDTDTNTWVVAGTAYGLVPSPLGSGQILANKLPPFYLDLDSSQATQSQPTGPLQRYLNLLGWELDWIQSEIAQLLNLNNIDLVRGDLLTVIGQMFGVTIEPVLGMAQTRSLIKNLTHAYKYKGTTTGLATIASSYTGFGAKITAGKNLEVQLDSAATDLAVGIWANHLTNCTLAPSTAVAPQHTTYQPVYGKSNQVTALTASSAANVAFSSSNLSDAQTSGIPVVAGQQVTISNYFRAATTVRSWVAQIDWYNSAGVLLSSTVGTATADTTTGMTRVSVTGTAPTGAAFLGRTYSATGLANGEVHYFDASQVERAASPTTWDPPRDIKINLFPNRQNLVPNPSFEADVANWTFTNVTTPASATPPTTAQAGTKAARLTATAAGNMVATTVTLPVAALSPYFLSMYFLPGTGATARNVLASLVWQLAVGGPTTITGTAALEVAATWTRVSIFGISPSNATGVQVVGQVTGAALGEVHWLDAVLLEPGNFLNPYFDGNSQPSSDYIFEGTPNESISDYYPMLQTKLTRLAEVLPDFVPLGSTFTLVSGATAFANAGLVD